MLSGERRTALVAWLRERDAIAIEDDYDAEYRYDRAAVGALQGLDADRVVYLGSASKTLAPALRLGWMVLPRGARRRRQRGEGAGRPRHEPRSTSTRSPASSSAASSTATCGGCALQYRARRDALVAALGEALPEATVQGVAAGLHVTVAPARRASTRRPCGAEAAAPAHRAEHDRRQPDRRRRRSPPTLLLGYARLPEAAIAAGVRELAAAVRAVAPA